MGKDKSATQKEALELLQFSSRDFAVCWPFQVPSDTVSDPAVIQSMSSACEVSTLQERGGETLRQGKLLLSSFKVPVPIAAALCNSKN